LDATIDRKAERIAELRALLEVYETQEQVNRIIARVKTASTAGVPLAEMLTWCLSDESVRPIGDKLLLAGVVIGAYGKLDLVQ
jgi:hypothetical protein